MTDGAAVDSGTSEISDAGAPNSIDSYGKAIITITGTKVFRIEHRCQTTKNTLGLGVDSTIVDPNIYTVVEIVKIA